MVVVDTTCIELDKVNVNVRIGPLINDNVGGW